MIINEIFERCQKLTMSKRHDYTSSLDNHENFRRSAMIAGWFVSDEDKPYVVLIGTKLARLASLLVPGKVPNNESIEDTFLDLINYCALWMERRTSYTIKDKSIEACKDRKQNKKKSDMCVYNNLIQHPRYYLSY